MVPPSLTGSLGHKTLKGAIFKLTRRVLITPSHDYVRPKPFLSRSNLLLFVAKYCPIAVQCFSPDAVVSTCLDSSNDDAIAFALDHFDLSAGIQKVTFGDHIDQLSTEAYFTGWTQDRLSRPLRTQVG